MFLLQAAILMKRRYLVEESQAVDRAGNPGYESQGMPVDIRRVDENIEGPVRRQLCCREFRRSTASA